MSVPVCESRTVSVNVGGLGNTAHAADVWQLMESVCYLL